MLAVADMLVTWIIRNGVLTKCYRFVWVCLLSASEKIDTSSVTPSVSEWLFWVISCKLNWKHEAKPEGGGFIDFNGAYVCCWYIILLWILKSRVTESNKIVNYTYQSSCQWRGSWPALVCWSWTYRWIFSLWSCGESSCCSNICSIGRTHCQTYREG